MLKFYYRDDKLRKEQNRLASKLRHEVGADQTPGILYKLQLEYEKKLKEDKKLDKEFKEIVKE